jgi:hypothetical protein
MNLERLIEAAWLGPEPFDCWKPYQHTKPQAPTRPAYPRPARPRAVPAPFRLDLADTARDIFDAAEDDNNREEAMIWDAGRIHGPEGDRATALTIECALSALEDGEPLSWWEPEWTAADGIAAMRAASVREAHHDADERRRWAENRATDAAPETDPGWAAYDASFAAFKVAEQEWHAAAARRGREVSGYASEAEHRAAVVSPWDQLEATLFFGSRP